MNLRGKRSTNRSIRSRPARPAKPARLDRPTRKPRVQRPPRVQKPPIVHVPTTPQNLGVIIPETKESPWWEKGLNTIGNLGLNLLTNYATDRYNTSKAIERSKLDF